MNDKKNENEKIMKYISSKLKDGEIPLMLQEVALFAKANKQDAHMIITSSSLYFVQNLSIKKYCKATSIQCVIVSPYCNETVIFYDPKGDHSITQAIRIQSSASFKIIQNITSVREKFCQMKQLLTVMVSPAKNLQAAANSAENTSKSRVFGFLFKKKQDKPDLQQRLSGQGEILYVSQQDFALEIGQKMYSQIYKNVKLLYISNSQSFRFFEQKYQTEQISSTKKLFKPKVGETQRQRSQSNMNVKQEIKKYVLLRKIVKTTDEDNKRIADALRKYKNEQYKEQILFAIETETHFEILTTFIEGQKDCQSMILDHQFLSEKDLKSIFFKLVEMIESSSVIFYSLSPENIIVGKHGIRISKIFSCLKRRAQVDYLAPEQFIKEEFTEQQIQLINLWKVGILLFELAYGNVPFPSQYVANAMITQNTQIELKFPIYSLRTQQFQAFIKSILRINPLQRGTQSFSKILGSAIQKWKQDIKKIPWLK